MNRIPHSPWTGVFTSHGESSRIVQWASDRWIALLGNQWTDRIMTADVQDRFHAKQGRSVARWTIGDGNGALVVYLKRHYQLARWRGWCARLTPGWALSPGRQEAQNLIQAKAAGLRVPEIAAWAEFLHSDGRLQSVLAVVELTDQLPLHEAIPLAFRSLSGADFARWKRGLIVELARIARQMHLNRFFHKDLYLCHFYIPQTDCLAVPDNWQNRVTMIDLHRFAQHRWTGSWWQAKDLAQLWYSLDGVEGTCSRDAVAFWKAYRAGDWGRSPVPGTLTARLVRIRHSNYLSQKIRRQNRRATRA